MTAVGEGDLPEWARGVWGYVKELRQLCGIGPTLPWLWECLTSSQQCAPVNKLVLWRVSLSQEPDLFSVVQSFQSCRYLWQLKLAGTTCQPAVGQSPAATGIEKPRRRKIIISGTKNKTTNANLCIEPRALFHSLTSLHGKCMKLDVCLQEWKAESTLLRFKSVVPESLGVSNVVLTWLNYFFSFI